jgi:Predicted pyrophosphatase
MIDLKELQKQIYQNKVDKHFNVSDIPKEFCFAQAELSEAFTAYIRHEEGIGEELADVFIFLLSIAEMLDVDLEKELLSKIERNKKRTYVTVNGALVKADDQE